MDYAHISIIASFIAMVAGIWKITYALKKDVDESIAKMFKRFDNHKETVDKKLFLMQDINDNKYMRIDLCNKTSGTIENELKRIHDKLDLLLKERIGGNKG